MTTSVEVRPTRPVLDAEAIADLRARLGRVRLTAASGGAWRHGVSVDWLAGPTV